MTLPEAIQILLVHQAWRLGADIEMAEPKVITEALDVLLNYHTETTSISDDEIEAQALTFAKEESYGELSTDLWKGYLFGAKRMRDQLKSKQ